MVASSTVRSDGRSPRRQRLRRDRDRPAIRTASTLARRRATPDSRLLPCASVVGAPRVPRLQARSAVDERATWFTERPTRSPPTSGPVLPPARRRRSGRTARTWSRRRTCLNAAKPYDGGGRLPLGCSTVRRGTRVVRRCAARGAPTRSTGFPRWRRVFTSRRVNTWTAVGPRAFRPIRPLSLGVRPPTDRGLRVCRVGNSFLHGLFPASTAARALGRTGIGCRTLVASTGHGANNLPSRSRSQRRGPRLHRGSYVAGQLNARSTARGDRLVAA